VNNDNIPDCIVYFCDADQEGRRKCFKRIKCKELLNKDDKPFLVKFEEERALNLVSDNDFPGFVYLKISLFN